MKTILPSFSTTVAGERFFGYLLPATPTNHDDLGVVVGFAAENGCANSKYVFIKKPTLRTTGFSSRCGGYDPDLWKLAAKIAQEVSFTPNADGTFTFHALSLDVPIRLIEAAMPS